MDSETPIARIQRGTWISQRTNSDLDQYAMEKGLMRDVPTRNEDGTIKSVFYIPNYSEAIRSALEEFFASRKKE